MPSIQFTDISIRALKSDAQIDYWDTKMPGFGIRVSVLKLFCCRDVHHSERR